MNQMILTMTQLMAGLEIWMEAKVDMWQNDIKVLSNKIKAGLADPGRESDTGHEELALGRANS